MISFNSEFKNGDVKIGQKFDFGKRKWEVTVVSYDTFNAKTIDNKGGKQYIIAQFSYQK
ncbi:MAG TPA: hypothetical protein VFI61_04010 [Patescibacteria group bacterium]|nr:hypothetical protein [Patescibacteria group bacterium]